VPCRCGLRRIPLQPALPFSFSRVMSGRGTCCLTLTPTLSRKEREVAVWQFGSATRREGASRSRDRFVNCPGKGTARARAILILRTAQSSYHRRYSTFRLDSVMTSERPKSVRRAIDAPLTTGTPVDSDHHILWFGTS
jgi:hypothetical protein